MILSWTRIEISYTNYIQGRTYHIRLILVIDIIVALKIVVKVHAYIVYGSLINLLVNSDNIKFAYRYNRLTFISTSTYRRAIFAITSLCIDEIACSSLCQDLHTNSVFLCNQINSIYLYIKIF